MGKLNIDAVKRRSEEENRSSSRSNTEWDKLVSGKNVRRILWPKGDREMFYEEGYVHYNVGPDGKGYATCPKTFGRSNPCPICEYAEKLRNSSEKDDKALGNDLRSKRKIYVNVISRDDEEEKVKVLGIGATILKGLMDTICDPDYGDITDFEEGRDVTITKKGQGLNTEYSVLPKPKSTVASQELSMEEIENAMSELDKMFSKKSYEELNAMLFGEEEKAEDEDTSENSEYDDMSLEELEDLCDERGIRIPSNHNRLKLINLLTEDDGASDDDDEEDDVQDAIEAALAKRKKK